MRVIELFILRPVATLLISAATVLLGWLGYALMPVAPLPQVDFPTIMVEASLAGASPETMAATVAAPLERSMGQIAGISEMTSTSSQGSTNVIIQFELDRDIDGAARDVQAAINAARSQLPSSMASLPTYHKANPSDAPILMLALTSKRLSSGELYDLASSELQQKIAQVSGVGEVSLRGSALPAVRVELEPYQLSHYGISLDTVRRAIAEATTVEPKGQIQGEGTRWWIDADGQLDSAEQYRPLLISYSDGRAVTLGDVATVSDSIEDIYTAGFYNGQPAVMLGVTRSAGANMLETVDEIKALLPALREMLPDDVELDTVIDRSTTIRASLHETERTLGIAILLVIAVVLVFLRNLRAMVIPAVALPISLIGTCAVMYLLGYSLDNLSLMALIIATGFVVDDAIVVLENVSRHLEEGKPPLEAAMVGAREVGFTVLAMTLSLIAVFIPILLMGDIVGRLFREFAVTLSISLIVSLLVSLSLTPMLCSRLLKAPSAAAARRGGWLRACGRMVERGLDLLAAAYVASLGRALKRRRWVMLVLVFTVGLNIYLYTVVQKGFFPSQDTGMLMGQLRADQNISFQALSPVLIKFSQLIESDPAVANVMSSTGSGGFGSRNSANFFISLKPYDEREDSALEVANRLSAKAQGTPGAQLFLMPAEDLHIGGRSANATYQYSLQADDLAMLREWTPKVYAALSALPELSGVDSDAQDGGQQVELSIDRQAAIRYGIDVDMIDTFLNNAFSQRQVATLYRSLNQYYVVMGLESEYTQDPAVLDELFVLNDDGDRVPISAFASFKGGSAPLSVNHQDQTATSTIAFNLADGASLERAQRAIQRALVAIGLPDDIHGGFAGTAQAYQSLISSMPWLILAALLAMYIVLGVLYESLIHPLTILSTLPSAGIGALILMLVTGTQLTVIALIGILLLIGIVKKNAIMMIDFALDHERRTGAGPEQAILAACRMRFRPILMTSLAAFFGALPMVLASGGDADLRRPLGMAIVGGLVVSQLLTLYTTPVVYLYLDRAGRVIASFWRRRVGHLPDSAR
ncbi:efflux RND transporter permease subunit [Halotalea alkalilenta]|uniref:Multidrug transporter subunit MdtC n=1 Tax=Halotalea alkalilenta TaxID=376489 RepID=A0A172YCR2_9GAMM|nr:efflux RND transporter permease subunit [Halotalea alkalilenta]ANF57039.1 multidrug transporter subunit MdtC [Halotalea alkalilenta]